MTVLMKNFFTKIIMVCCCVLIWRCGGAPEEQAAAEVETDSNRQTVVPPARAQPVTDTLEQSLIDQGLVNIQTIDSTIFVELKYSTTDNFVGVDVYGDLAHCYLQPEVARMLANAHRFLKAAHPAYRFLVYDGVRPLRVQYILWNTLDDPYEQRIKYVADPKEGSIHNYGSAIDLTLADTSGKPVDMGTPYDYFGPLAYPVMEDDMIDREQLTRQQVQNRLVLRAAMQKAGFSTITSEWWHFNAFSRAQAQARYKMVE